MSALDDVLAQPTGARFLRADLHIHSYGASHDVRHASMTSAAIVQTAANAFSPEQHVNPPISEPDACVSKLPHALAQFGQRVHATTVEVH
jgi:hypothetical protein